MLKLIIVYIFISGLCLDLKAQDTLKVIGNINKENIISISRKDSVIIVNFTFTLQSEPKNNRFAIKLKNGSMKKFKSDSIRTAFYEYIYSGILDNSDSSKWVDYIKGHLQDSTILIQVISKAKKGTVKNDSVNSILVNPGKVTTEIDKESINPTLVYVMFFILVLIIAFLLFLLFRKKRKIKDPIPLQANMEIPSMLINYFGIDKKNKDTGLITDLIIQKHKQSLKENTDELKHLKDNLKKLAEEKSEVEKGVLQQKELLNNKDALLKKIEIEKENLENNLKETRLTLKEQKEIAEIILSKFYHSVTRALSDNSNMNADDAKKLVMVNMITAAIHSVSYFRILNGTHMNSDLLNVELLKGKPAKETAVINSQSPFNQSDPFTYYIIQLLKEQGIDQLEGVFVHGYKVG